MRVVISNQDGHMSISAAIWLKGQRLIAKVDKQYFAGTVTRVGKNKVHILFDDGVEGDVDIPVTNVRRMESRKRVARPMTRQEAEAMIAQKGPAKPKGRHFAISDIHGCFDQFKALLHKIGFTNADTLYILGDVIDHGPGIKQLLDYLMKHPNIHCMPGNHEDLLLRVIARPKLEKMWLGKGGQQTLDSFGVESAAEIPHKYIDWLKHLPLHLVHENTIMSHAGVDLQHKSPLRETKKNRDFTLWNREVKNKHKTLRIVYGHSPQKLSAIKKMAGTNSVCIDGGCSKGDKLVAFNLDDNSVEWVRGHKVEHE